MRLGCGSREEGRGERLLREIRYGLMEASRPREVVLKAEEMLAGLYGVLLRELAREAIAVQELRRMCGRGGSIGFWAAMPSLGGRAWVWRGETMRQGGDSIRLCETSKT